jgi:hypothetical protein
MKQMSATRRAKASHATLAKRLAHVEALFDLHCAGINPIAAASIRRQLAGVRAELEWRAAYGLR